VQQWSQSISGVNLHITADGTSVFVADGGDNRVLKRLASTGAAGSPATFVNSGVGDGQFN
jgi:hypothetical protein